MNGTAIWCDISLHIPILINLKYLTDDGSCTTFLCRAFIEKDGQEHVGRADRLHARLLIYVEVSAGVISWLTES